MTTISAAWRQGRARLQDSLSPALDARLLLEYVLGRDHAYLIAHGDEPLAGETLAAYERLIERAAAQEPVPYLIGRAPFMGLDFAVSHDVLIPRLETEALAAMVIEWGKGRHGLRIVDIGTGSGCIAVTLAHYLPQADVVAVDVSGRALAVAAANTATHAPGRVQLVQGNLMEPLAGRFDVIAANLPYIARQEWPTLPIGVKSFEPVLALDGGPDGLDMIRALLPQAAGRLQPGGLVLLEIGWRQGEAAAALARASFPDAAIIVRPDFAGHDRYVVIQLENEKS